MFKSRILQVLFFAIAKKKIREKVYYIILAILSEFYGAVVKE